jgi:hypothetical protein
MAFWLGSYLLTAGIAEPAAWDPASTRAVIIGVLAWQNPSIGTFAKEDRKDQELYDLLVRRGVPPANISLLLDQQATGSAIEAALAYQLKASARGETLIFYYAGHGVQKDDRILFLPFDFGREDGLDVRALENTIASTFLGERVLLFADCCYSGALEDVAHGLQRRGLLAASLTSATSWLPSVSNWTFTQTLLDCLAGEERADRDGDQTVTFAEMIAEVADAMRFHELQQNGVSSADGLADLILARSQPSDRGIEARYSLYDYVLITHEGKKVIGRLSGFQDGQFIVELQDYSQRVPLQVPPEKLSPLPASPPSPPSPEKARDMASVEGKYTQLLREFEVEPDYLEFGEFEDYGHYPACGYRGYRDLPEGYWVYVYPRWYIWGQRRAEQHTRRRQSSRQRFRQRDAGSHSPGTVKTTRSYRPSYRSRTA